MGKAQNRADITDRVWTEIETLQWVLSGRSIRRLLTGQENKLSYNNTTISSGRR
jgi:hypothetical protein